MTVVKSLISKSVSGNSPAPCKIEFTMPTTRPTPTKKMININNKKAFSIL